MKSLLKSSVLLIAAVLAAILMIALTPCRCVSSEPNEPGRISWGVYVSYVPIPYVLRPFYDLRQSAIGVADAELYYWGVLPVRSRWRVILPFLYFGASVAFAQMYPSANDEDRRTAQNTMVAIALNAIARKVNTISEGTAADLDKRRR